MKIAILGAGAMGSLIGGKLAANGADVTLLARGAHAKAMAERGLTLSTDAATQQVRVTVATDASDLTRYDMVWLTSKAHQLASLAPLIPNIITKDSVIIPAVNGMPWWYFYGAKGALAGTRLNSLDADGTLERNIAHAQVIGCVNYLAGSVVEPGHVHHVPVFKPSLVLGELSGEMTERLSQTIALLDGAGLMPDATADIRTAVWHKLWGNSCFNPLGALTHATMDELAKGYDDIDLIAAVMNESRFIADKLGITLGQTIQSRVDAASRMVGHMTSMQHDMLAGRETEVEAILGSVREVGRLLHTDTPYLNALYSLIRLKSRFYRP